MTPSGTIYLRGYLVLSTPTLTKRHFPEGVLRGLDKDTTTPVADETVDVDPERMLLDAHAVELCREGTNLSLTADFQQAWRKSIHTTRVHDLDENYLAGAFGTDDDQITVGRHSEAFVAHTDVVVSGSGLRKLPPSPNPNVV